MLHVLIGENENLDKVRNATDEDTALWVVPKTAKPKERIALFFPGERGFVALGTLMNEPSGPTMRGDRIVYLADIGDIVCLGKTITLDDLKESPVEEINGWPWLRYPRNFTTLETPRSERLLDILEAGLPRASRARQAQAREQAKLPQVSRAKLPQAREQDEIEAMEGFVQERRTLSRNKRLRDAALERANGSCEACKKNFGQFLDGLGERVLEVHHKKQVALMKTPELTNVKDLAVVCANCHRMIHANRQKAMDVKELQRKLRQASMG